MSQTNPGARGRENESVQSTRAIFNMVWLGHRLVFDHDRRW